MAKISEISINNGHRKTLYSHPESSPSSFACEHMTNTSGVVSLKISEVRVSCFVLSPDQVWSYGSLIGCQLCRCGITKNSWLHFLNIASLQDVNYILFLTMHIG